MRHWRKMTWVLIAWSALILVWVIVGVNSASCESEGEFQDACEAGTGIGVGLILFLGFMVFVILALVWFMTRPRDVRIVTAGPVGPPPSMRSASPAASPPPPTPGTPPPGWYSDPLGMFDYRWFDGVWTDQVANAGDGSSSTDPVGRRPPGT